MSVQWEAFKSCLGKSGNVCVTYIDDEGSEIPIQTESEFLEALKFSMTHGKNQLKLILKPKNNKLNKIVNNDKRYSERDHLQFKDSKRIKKSKTICTSEAHIDRKGSEKLMQYTQQLNDYNCECCNGIPPLWFSHYIKKFKKKLMEEIKFTVNDAVQKVLSERELTQSKAIFTQSHNISNKKNLKRDSCSLTRDQRKLLHEKKFHNFYLSTLKKLEKRLEKCGSKNRDVIKTANQIYYENLCNLKSVLFQSSENKWEYEPGQYITIELIIINNGLVLWENAKLFCECEGLSLQENVFHLGRVQPQKKNSVLLAGRVSNKEGIYQIQCSILDGVHKVGSKFCEHIKVSKSFCSTGCRGKKGTSSVLVKCQKKVEANISEIEERLQKFNFITNGEDLDREHSGSINNLNEKLVENLLDNNLQNSENMLTNLSGHVKGSQDLAKKNLNALSEDTAESDTDSDINIICESEEENSFVLLAIPKNDLKSEENEAKNGETKVAEELSEATKIIRNDEPKRSIFAEIDPVQDEGISFNSDKAAIKMQEPIQTKTNSPFTVDVSETKKDKSSAYEFSGANLTEPILNFRQNATEGSATGQKIIYNKNGMSNGEQESTGVPETTTNSPFTVNVSEAKKDKSSAYEFSGANLTEPILKFTKGQKIIYNKKNGMSNGEARKGEQKSTRVREKKESRHNLHGCKARMSRPKTSGGRNANSSKGNGKRTDEQQPRKAKKIPRDQSENTSNSGEKGNSGPNERINEDSSYILPEAFLNGASNVATYAFSTAKSAINNFQAFVSKGKTEKATPAANTTESEVGSNEQTMDRDLLILWDMGFKDFQKNVNLLARHKHDVGKVVEELLSEEN